MVFFEFVSGGGRIHLGPREPPKCEFRELERPHVGRGSNGGGQRGSAVGTERERSKECRWRRGSPGSGRSALAPPLPLPRYLYGCWFLIVVK